MYSARRSLRVASFLCIWVHPCWSEVMKLGGGCLCPAAGRSPWLWVCSRSAGAPTTALSSPPCSSAPYPHRSPSSPCCGSPSPTATWTSSSFSPPTAPSACTSSVWSVWATASARLTQASCPIARWRHHRSVNMMLPRVWWSFPTVVTRLMPLSCGSPSPTAAWTSSSFSPPTAPSARTSCVCSACATTWASLTSPSSPVGRCRHHREHDVAENRIWLYIYFVGEGGKQVGSMNEESQVRGCYNLTFIYNEPGNSVCVGKDTSKQNI